MGLANSCLVSQAKREVSVGLCSLLEAGDENPFPASTGCWQNPVPDSCRTTCQCGLFSASRGCHTFLGSWPFLSSKTSKMVGKSLSCFYSPASSATSVSLTLLFSSFTLFPPQGGNCGRGWKVSLEEKMEDN